MKAVVKGSTFLSLAFVVFSIGCAGTHKTSNSAQASQPQLQSTASENGFVRPDPTIHDAQGNQSGAASQESGDGILGTPLQSELAAQVKSPGATPSVNDSDLIDLPADLKNAVDLKKIRAVVFNQINQERKDAGLPPVGYDKIGELAASLHVLEQVQGKSWLSHFSLNGDLPYMRYSQADGYNANSENAAVWQGNMDTRTPGPLDPTPCNANNIFPVPAAGNIENIGALVGSSLECDMVNEKPPADGHRKTILDPHATSVGISLGVVVGNDQFTGKPGRRIIVFLVEEFQTQGLASVNPWPISVQSSQTKSINFSGSLVDGLSFDHALLFFEVPVPKTVQQAASLNHYSYPSKYKIMIQTPTPGFKTVFKDKDGNPIQVDFDDHTIVQGKNFSIPISLDQGPGVYTVNVFVTRQGDKTPFPIASRSLYVLP